MKKILIVPALLFSFCVFAQVDTTNKIFTGIQSITTGSSVLPDSLLNKYSLLNNLGSSEIYSKKTKHFKKCVVLLSKSFDKDLFVWKHAYMLYFTYSDNFIHVPKYEFYLPDKKTKIKSTIIDYKAL